jgi:CCR4-NOT complex subunit CAF16
MSSPSQSQVEPLIKVSNVSFKYLPRDNEERGSTFTEGEYKGFQLKDVSLNVYPGERIILASKNGQGKSTLLSLIAGKRKPSAGSISVLGRDAFDDTALQKDICLIGEPWPAEALFSCKVEAVVTPAPEIERRDALARELHLPMKASLNKMSSGQKRRVQILHGLMGTKKVILMDECSTDIDVAERVTLMNFVAKECERIGACCVYATHILDGVETWATRIVMLNGGQLVRDEPFSTSKEVGSDSLEKKVTGWFLELTPSLSLLSSSADGERLAINSANFKTPAKTVTTTTKEEVVEIAVKNFAFRNLFENVNHNILKGQRVLFVGCNGCGKTTFLELLGGHMFFTNKGNQLMVENRPCFQDTKSHEMIAFGGHWWDRVPGGEMHVREMVPLPLDERAESLRSLLAVNLDWDVRHVSTGELKRIQLFMKLYTQKPVVLLDEATADLDIHMRAALLHFLYDESEKRNVTIIYSTHIFEGLGDWPTDVIFVDRSQQNFIVHNNIDKKFTSGTDVNQLRKFLIQTLIELKSKEKWEEWYV